ncbi:UNVERIFIED_CONTAM: hypothetical protein GTU68_002063 [Idotea baltica]|nr:hypothetical protein [Idotea baltica]
MIDNREKVFDASNHELIQQLCHRRFGIGADGIILLENDADYDFKMIYINADGFEGSMCGNGGRCIVAFAKQLNIINTNTKFNAYDGLHEAEINPSGLINLKMVEVSNIEQRVNNDFVLDTGSPHYVRFVNNVTDINIKQEGKKIRHSEEFNKVGINVNFVSKGKLTNELNLETFERGVEAVTYACGTGAVATAICHTLHSEAKDGNYSITLITTGGKLIVNLNKTKQTFTNIWLEGEAKLVFEGQI